MDNRYGNSYAASFQLPHAMRLKRIGFHKSEWIIKGRFVLRQAFALFMVSITVDTFMAYARVQAMIFLANKSMTQLSYTELS